MEEKNALRRQMKAEREGWEAEYRQGADVAIAHHVRKSAVWLAAGTVFAYVSVGCEVDTRALIDAALQEGKRVCAPRCLDKGRMEARGIASLDALVPAAYGLLEPAEDAPLVPPEEIDLILVPCLAADRNGHRLGYGGGYYDRFLESAAKPSICLCRRRALLDGVPHEEHDAAVDAVATETGMIPIMPSVSPETRQSPASHETGSADAP